MVKLPDSATAAQRAHFELCYVLDPLLEQEVHKASYAARRQKQALDAKPGAGHTARYGRGARHAIISDDREGTGFSYDQVCNCEIMVKEKSR